MDINLFEIFGGTITLAAVAIVAMGITFVIDTVKKIKNDKVQAVLKTNEEVINKVKDVVVNTTGKYIQTVVDELKKDGRWNKENAGKVFNNAFNEIQGQLGKDTIDILNDIRGNTEVYLTNVIENTLRENKNYMIEAEPIKLGIDIKEDKVD
ncbi:hypothetical protein [Miniphocaeibacter halophilus]|uniref:Uncharacterized protein n=1 Tax=Miniphocaeibacter halophilus TaxID=2931922 RepID=A0AC61MSM6_9FIRM|nr:hypothetical protein [Miniphocaeibacter halophilus]QQK07456.1 hypothetical protein JFY71_09075 [Miniphocaeibacter halophilus]